MTTQSPSVAGIEAYIKEVKTILQAKGFIDIIRPYAPVFLDILIEFMAQVTTACYLRNDSPQECADFIYENVSNPFKSADAVMSFDILEVIKASKTITTAPANIKYTPE